MNTPPELEPVFPLSIGGAERRPLRAPRLVVNPRVAAGPVLGHRAFMRAWAARRAARAAEAAGMPGRTPAGPPAVFASQEE